MDEVVRIAKSTMIEDFYHFVRAVAAVFGKQYLRAPSVEDTTILMAMYTKIGWSSMFGCIDYMHRRWKNWLTMVWKGQY